MTMLNPAKAGVLMAAEMEEAPYVFFKASSQDLSAHADFAAFNAARSIYTIARGSSDAAAMVLSYEMMRELRKPVASLPPSALGYGQGLSMQDMAALVLSQSGGSDDLVSAAQEAANQGAIVASITNAPDNRVAAASDIPISITAGEERAVPATKTVVGTIGAGMALVSALSADYRSRCDMDAEQIVSYGRAGFDGQDDLFKSLSSGGSVYVIGRDCSFGAAVETALKLKETCAIHAEAFSASEVLHGPIQLASGPLTAIVLESGPTATEHSLNLAHSRLMALGAQVHRIRAKEIADRPMTPAAGAALLLCNLYPVIRRVALDRGFDPDRPNALSKVTNTR